MDGSGAGGGASGADSGPLTGRSTAKTAAVLVAGVVVVAAAAGAVYVYQQDDGPVDLRTVPDGVDSVSYADVDKLQDDPAVERLVDTALSVTDAEETPDDYGELQAEFEAETGLSLDDLHSVVNYAKNPEGGAANASEYSGALLRTDWGGEAVADAYANVTDAEYERGEYGGRTVYRPAGDGGTGANRPWIGVLDDDRLVVGSPAAVQDAVDVANGDAPALDGELKSAFREARGGYVKTATRVPTSRVPSEDVSLGGGELDVGPFEDLDIVTAAYYVEGNTVGAQLALYATDESAADDVRDLLVGAVSLASATVEAEDVESALRDVEIERDGERVDVRFENKVDDLEAVIQALAEERDEESTEEASTTTGSAAHGPGVQPAGWLVGSTLGALPSPGTEHEDSRRGTEHADGATPLAWPSQS